MGAAYDGCSMGRERRFGGCADYIKNLTPLIATIVRLDVQHHRKFQVSSGRRYWLASRCKSMTPVPGLGFMGLWEKRLAKTTAGASTTCGGVHGG